MLAVSFPWLGVLVAALGDEAVPVSPVWGFVNASLNAATLIAVALIYRRRR